MCWNTICAWPMPVISATASPRPCACTRQSSPRTAKAYGWWYLLEPGAAERTKVRKGEHRYFRPMKLLFPTSLIAAALLLAGCGDGKSDAAKQMAAAADSARLAAMVDLSAHHLPLVLQMPPGSPAPTLLWKDEIGKLEVRAGERFALAIAEIPPDLERLKADLARDLLKRNTIVEETPELLIYRSEFPDDTTLVFHHFER